MGSEAQRHIDAVSELLKGNRLYIAPTPKQERKPVYDHWLDAWAYFYFGSQPRDRQKAGEDFGKVIGC